MPSPFPGMDPYLEHPARWTGVHDGLIGAARAQLNAVLPAGYVADIGERRHRAWAMWAFEAWAIDLRQRLRVISVPVAQGDQDVELDLQAACDRNYDEGAYDRRTDYSQAPYVPLAPEDAVWVDALLRERRLRT